MIFRRVPKITRVIIKFQEVKMGELIKEIDNFNKERDWDQFHSPENLAK